MDKPPLPEIHMDAEGKERFKDAVKRLAQTPKADFDRAQAERPKKKPRPKTKER